MTDTAPLDGPGIPPASGGKAKQLVILIHGVGADGNDLIGLAPYFQHVLPEAMFLSPHAPFPFDMAPTGRQWFSLQDFSSETRLRGVRSAAPILNAFIDAKLAENDLDEDRLALIGFSQGTMMALHVGLRREKRVAGIIGYSGMLVGPELLADEMRSKPPVLLTHGDADPVLPVRSMPMAVEGLNSVGINVKAHIRPGLGHGIDDECVRLGSSFLTGIFNRQP